MNSPSRSLQSKLFLVICLLVAVSAGAYVAAAETYEKRYFPLMPNRWPIPPTPRPGRLLISEVLADPEGDEPEGEWIEIYNPGDFSISLDAYMIGDETIAGGGEGMYRFPAGSALDAKQTRLIANRAAEFEAAYGFLPDYEMNESNPWVANMLPDHLYASGATTLENNGDDVVALNLQHQAVDAVSWGSAVYAFNPSVERAPQGASIARMPPDQDTDLAADWVVQLNPDPGQVTFPVSTPTPTSSTDPAATATTSGTPVASSTPTPLPPASILISEVLYDPLNEVDIESEWIEIYNPGSSTIPLIWVMIGDEETQGGGEGMMRFPEQAEIMGGESQVIAARGDVFYTTYGFYPHYEIQDSPANLPLMQRNSDWASGIINLRDDGDEVLLMDFGGAWIDAVSWGDSSFAFDPSVPLVASGITIERYPGNIDTDSAQDWRASTSPNPGQVDLTSPTPTPSPSNTPTCTLTPVPSATFTPTPVSLLVINEIHADPHVSLGDANGDGVSSISEDEFIEIVNASGASIELSGWSIWDAIQSRHTFPSGTVLADGCALVVFGGGQPDGDFGGAIVQTASSGGLYFSNEQEIVSLRAPDSSVASTYTYGDEAEQDQSITRDPDVNGPDPLVIHSQATGAAGRLYSPGTRVDGSLFWGCARQTR